MQIMVQWVDDKFLDLPHRPPPVSTLPYMIQLQGSSFAVDGSCLIERCGTVHSTIRDLI